MKLSKIAIANRVVNFYEAYLLSLTKSEREIEKAFDNLIGSIMKAISLELEPQLEAKIVVIRGSEARDIQFLARAEGEKFELAGFIEQVNFDIYETKDGFIVKKLIYHELLEEGE